MRKALSLCLACFLCLMGAARASAQVPSLPSALLAYIAQQMEGETEFISFADDGSPAMDTWQYEFEFPTLQYAVEAAGIAFRPRAFLGLMGSADDAMPYLYIGGTSSQPFDVPRVSLRAGSHEFTMDCTLAEDYLFFGDVEPDGQSQAFELILVMGSDGVTLLSALKENACALEMYVFLNDTDAYLALRQPALEGAPTAYDLFYEGLLRSGYLDVNGNVSPETTGLLSRVDATPAYPAMTLRDDPAAAQEAYSPLEVGTHGHIILEIRTRLYELGYFRNKPDQTEYTHGMVKYLHEFQERNGLPITDVITPEAQALLFSENALPRAALAPDEATGANPSADVEMTGFGDWGRSSDGHPWLELDLRNVSETATVSGATFTYYCQDAEGNTLHTGSGDIFGQATVEKTLVPGRERRMPILRIKEYAGVESVWIALSAYSLADGTQVDIPEGGLVYWKWSFE
ncbi:hypothetical protein LJC74_07385 [Eubacteriales bacterium OttesenSCG-928-A19]|nr:hypothetical protein [Eubacteriales bacterium OttesenSCG-928-A19]